MRKRAVLHRAILTAACTTAICLSSTAARADEPNVSFTNTSVFEYRLDNDTRDSPLADRDGNGVRDDDDYGLLLNRLNITGTLGDLQTSVRIDAFHLFNGFAFTEPDSAGDLPDTYRSDIVLERLNVRYKLGDWTLQVGDFPRQLGRGIVLSVRDVADVGRDLAIRGGEVAWRGDRVEFAVFGGIMNTANLDSISHRYNENVRDIVAGVDIGTRSLPFGDLRVFASWLKPEISALDSDQDWSFSGGASLDMPAIADWLGIYLEFDAQTRMIAGLERSGYAAYMQSDLVFGDWTALIEGVWLDGFKTADARTFTQNGSPSTGTQSSFIYNNPPTAERIDQEVLAAGSTAAGRLRVERYFFEPSVLAYINGLYRHDNLALTGPGTADAASNEERTWHAYAGIEWAFQQHRSRLNLSGGFRDTDRDGGTRFEDLKTLAHFEIDYLQSLSDKLSMHLQVFHENRTLTDSETTNHYLRGSTLFGFELSQLGGLTFELGYDTQDESDGAPGLFFAGILVWEISEIFRLRAIGGTQRGGIKCVAGVCRDFPDFAGGRLELVSRF